MKKIAFIFSHGIYFIDKNKKIDKIITCLVLLSYYGYTVRFTVILMVASKETYYQNDTLYKQCHLHLWYISRRDYRKKSILSHRIMTNKVHK